MIACFYTVISDFTISDQNNIFEIFLNDLFGNYLRRCSITSCFILDVFLNCLFICPLDMWIPKVIIFHIRSIECQKVIYSIPIVNRTANWSWDIKKELIFFCLHRNKIDFYYWNSINLNSFISFSSDQIYYERYFYKKNTQSHFYNKESF